MQRSARSMSQGMQATPPRPHESMPIGLQVEPEQHPSGQVVALHPEQTPSSQVSPASHSLQPSPPVPHAVDESPGRHIVPRQHPSHETLSHTHSPPRQRCPAAHVGPPPHPDSHCDGPTPVCMHIQPDSTRQLASQPSPPSASPSSHASRTSATTPSPQVGASPSTTSRVVISPSTNVADPTPAATTEPALEPYTRATNVDPASSSATSTTKDSSSRIVPGASG